MDVFTREIGINKKKDTVLVHTDGKMALFILVIGKKMLLVDMEN